MVDRELVDYVQSVSNFPEERVRAALVQQGWSFEQIDGAFIQAKHEKSLARKTQADNARIGALTASFILVVMLLASSGTPVTGSLVYSNPSYSSSAGIIVSEESIGGIVPEPVQRCSALNSLDKDKCFLQEAVNSKDILRCRAIVHAHLRDLCVNSISSV